MSAQRKRFAIVFRCLDSPWRARAALVILTIAGLLSFALFPSMVRLLGLNVSDYWFVDSYAVLSASDAFHAGLDVDKPNPLDIFLRRHAYTDWWFALHWLGLTRHENFWVGVAWIIAFACAAWLTLQPRTAKEAFACSVAMLSPAVLLAVNRANNDLVIFASLGLGALALGAARAWSWPLALLAIAMATGLKIYPVVAVAVFLLLRPARPMLVACAAAAFVQIFVLHDVWPALHRGTFAVPPALYTFGASVLLNDLGFAGKGALMAGSLVVALAAFALVRARVTVGLAEGANDFDRRVLFALSAVLLVACFFAGISFGYRLIFAMWLVPWLSAQASAARGPRRTVARCSLVLLFGVLWLDGLCCVVINGFIGPRPLLQLDAWLRTWRLITQPLTWLLITLLAGWLLDAAIAALRTLRPARTLAASSPASPV